MSPLYGHSLATSSRRGTCPNRVTLLFLDRFSRPGVREIGDTPFCVFCSAVFCRNQLNPLCRISKRRDPPGQVSSGIQSSRLPKMHGVWHAVPVHCLYHWKLSTINWVHGAFHSSMMTIYGEPKHRKLYWIKQLRFPWPKFYERDIAQSPIKKIHHHQNVLIIVPIAKAHGSWLV